MKQELDQCESNSPTLHLQRKTENPVYSLLDRLLKAHSVTMTDRRCTKDWYRLHSSVERPKTFAVPPYLQYINSLSNEEEDRNIDLGQESQKYFTRERVVKVMLGNLRNHIPESSSNCMSSWQIYTFIWHQNFGLAPDLLTLKWGHLKRHCSIKLTL